MQPGGLDAIERFITDVESKIGEMRNCEAATQDRLLAIGGETKSLATQREACKLALASVQKQAFENGQQLNHVRIELNGIHHRDGSVGSELAAQSLETLRTSYHEQRQFYQ